MRIVTGHLSREPLGQREERPPYQSTAAAIFKTTSFSHPVHIMLRNSRVTRPWKASTKTTREKWNSWKELRGIERRKRKREKTGRLLGSLILGCLTRATQHVPAFSYFPRCTFNFWIAIVVVRNGLPIEPRPRNYPNLRVSRRILTFARQ